jgi:hypothetical protein
MGPLTSMPRPYVAGDLVGLTGNVALHLSPDGHSGATRSSGSCGGAVLSRHPHAASGCRGRRSSARTWARSPPRTSSRSRCSRSGGSFANERLGDALARLTAARLSCIRRAIITTQVTSTGIQVVCGIHSMAIAETSRSRSPKTVDGDHRKRSTADPARVTPKSSGARRAARDGVVPKVRRWDMRCVSVEVTERGEDVIFQCVGVRLHPRWIQPALWTRATISRRTTALREFLGSTRWRYRPAGARAWCAVASAGHRRPVGEMRDVWRLSMHKLAWRRAK